MKSKNYYKNIAEQEKTSSWKWDRTDTPTSPETRKENMWKRVLNKVKTDKEDE